MTDLDKEWLTFISIEENTQLHTRPINQPEIKNTNTIPEIQETKLDFNDELGLTPEFEDITISNCTKLAFLTSTINLLDLFWKIDLIEYTTPSVGVVQKQIKTDSRSIEQVNDIQNKLMLQPFYFKQNIIKQREDIFMDKRKISIGISKMDILKKKKKKIPGCFYNCFVIILRMFIDNMYKDYHIKIFNTGKIEIPGILDDTTFSNVLNTLLYILQPHFPNDILQYKPNIETVIINSNFNCGFCIHLNKLNHIVKNKYNLETIYDPSSYPGIVCKYYVQYQDKRYKNSFMIFRTGCILIVGQNEIVLRKSYAFLLQILKNEKEHIYQSPRLQTKAPKIKIYKRTILVTN